VHLEIYLPYMSLHLESCLHDSETQDGCMSVSDALLLSDHSGSGSEGSSQWDARQNTSCMLRQSTYHQRMRIEEIGGRKYQAYASDLSSQFICMGAVFVTPRS